MSSREATRSLPNHTSPILGRDQEIFLVEQLIADPNVPLVTLIGMSGVGKTRLAADIASRFDDADDSDVLFVPLSAIVDHELVVTEIGHALELQGEDLIDRLRERFSTWCGLVVLDNFEQVIEASGLIAEILPRNPDLTFIIPSQRALQIDGERVVRINPLPVPATSMTTEALRSVPSVQLLLNRASDDDVSLDETLQDESAVTAIGEICRNLDGIPLAIELAASRLSSLSPEVVLSQLKKGQRILTNYRRDAPVRQQTMHAAISWSFDLLPDDIGRAFLWLGAFPAGFDLEIVEKVVTALDVQSPAVDVISELVNLSFVRRSSSGTQPWYEMPVPIRNFCVTELDSSGERASAEELVSEHVMWLAGETEDAHAGSRAADWTPMVDQQLPTIRSSIDWCLDHAMPTPVIKTAIGLARYMEQIGRRLELNHWIDSALVWRDDLDEVDLINALLTQIRAHESAHAFSAAIAIGHEIEALLVGKELPLQKVRFLHSMGNIAQMQLKMDEAQLYFEQAIALANDHGLEKYAAVSHGMLAVGLKNRGEYRKTEEQHLLAHARLKTLGDKHSELTSLINLGACAISLAEFDRALAYLEDALLLARELDHRLFLPYVLLNQAAAQLELGLLDEATLASEEAIRIAAEHEYPLPEAAGYLNLCQIAYSQKDLQRTGEMALRSMDALPTDTVEVQIYAELGLTLAQALIAKADLVQATNLLCGAASFATAGGYQFESRDQQRLEDHLSQLANTVPDFAAERTRGELWDSHQYIRFVQFAAQRLAQQSHPGQMPTRTDRVRPDGLTSREQEILDLLIDGNSTQAMAEKLSISPRTVTTHLSNMMAKMRVGSRAEMITTALRGH